MGCNTSKQSLPSLSSSSNDSNYSVASPGNNGGAKRAANLGATPFNGTDASSSSSSGFSDGVKFSRLVSNNMFSGSTAVSISDDSSSSSSISSIDRSSSGGFDLIIQRNAIASFTQSTAGESVVEDWLAASEESTTMTSASASVMMNSTLSSAPRGGPAGTGPLSFCLSPSVQISKREDTGELEVVKNTTEVDRGHVRLPKTTATKGSWLTNRYCVNDYIILDLIGKGAHAEVRMAKNKTSNQLFAIKIMNRSAATEMRNRKEVDILKAIRHPNVLRLLEVIDDGRVDKVYLVTEHCERGDLMSIVKNLAASRSSIPEGDLKIIARQVIDGLGHLHSRGIVHADLKPSNILVKDDGRAVLADFGISEICRIRANTSGTPAFMSPEVVAGEAHDGRLADVYSLGATVYCLRFGRPPFVGRGREASARMRDLFEKIKQEDLAFPGDGVDAVLRSFLGGCLEKSPERRMTLDEAREHPWLRR